MNKMIKMPGICFHKNLAERVRAEEVEMASEVGNETSLAMKWLTIEVG